MYVYLKKGRLIRSYTVVLDVSQVGWVRIEKMAIHGGSSFSQISP